MEKPNTFCDFSLSKKVFVSKKNGSVLRPKIEPKNIKTLCTFFRLIKLSTEKRMSRQEYCRGENVNRKKLRKSFEVLN